MAQNMSHLPSAVYDTVSVRQAELAWAEHNQQPLYKLVELAGHSACEIVQQLFAATSRILVIAGQGNNGADALVCYYWLKQRGLDAELMVHEGKRATDEWQHAWQLLQDQRLTKTHQYQDFDEFDVIVDGLLGTGVRGELRDDVAALVSAINHSSAKVLSLDLPSGINADTGTGAAVIADVTLCMGAMKQGLLTSNARNSTGDLYFADIGLTDFLPAPTVHRIGREYLQRCLTPRAQNSHKGDSGRVTVIGGDYGMAGAVRLAAEACLRAGAGLVTVVSRPEHQLTINNGRPELMFRSCELVDMEVYSRLGWANVLVLGPGLGKQDWGYNLFKAAGLSDKPIVVDADALNILCEEPRRESCWVITPHPGEAARLLNTDIHNIEQDRFAAVRALHQRYGGVVLLKGAGTLICDGDNIYVAPVGNPGLASGGCGDVLSGIIGALLAQEHSLIEATCAAVVIHGEAADMAAQEGERGMLASDLMPWIRRLVNTE